MNLLDRAAVAKNILKNIFSESNTVHEFAPVPGEERESYDPLASKMPSV
jgi:hypothetical protein